jgi:hypothetical protein
MRTKGPFTFAETTSDQKTLSKRFREGKLARLLPGVYIDAAVIGEQRSTAVRTYLLDILGFASRDCALAWRNAVTLKPDDNGTVYLINAIGARSARRQQLDTLEIQVLPGDVSKGVERVTPELLRMTEARVLLESLQSELSRRRGWEKFLNREEMEAVLVKHLETYGEAGLKRLGDEVQELAATSGADIKSDNAPDNEAIDLLRERIGALLATREANGILVTAPALAHARGEPFDPTRIARFEQLASYLAGFEFPALPFEWNRVAWRTASFFESYFSNYIEGTEMTIEEAAQVMFEGKELQNRSGDSHDVAGCFRICGDAEEMAVTPKTADELLRLLQTRHRILLAGRPDKNPGSFKQRDNQAGSTYFVRSDQVIGTLTRGFDIYLQVPTGLKRAIFMQFLVTEVHPMDDGNGRLGRIMMNAELVADSQHKIIVPTVMRDDYLNGQRAATRSGDFRVISKVLYQLQHYSASLPLSFYDDTLSRITSDGGLNTPDEGLPLFNRARAPFRFDERAIAVK